MRFRSGFCVSVAAGLCLVGVPTASAATAGGTTYGGPTAPSSGTGQGQTNPGTGGLGDTGGQVYNAPNPSIAPTVPGSVAKMLSNGLAAAPSNAPLSVQKAIWAANRIVGLPYVWGGGHGAFKSSGYDCSGTVSFALHGGHLLNSPLDSSDFMHWGLAGRGSWITVYTNPGHAYVIIAGLRLDTSAAGDPGGKSGPRWRRTLRSNGGFTARHLLGL